MWTVLTATSLTVVAVAEAEIPVNAPTATVHQNIVTLAGTPGLRVTVPARATYLGADRFVVNGSNDCEMHIFADVDANRQVRKFYWVHFETVLANRPRDQMHYDTDQRSKMWGGTVWMSSEPARTSRIPKAGSDTEHFRAIVRNAGYTMPEGMATVRLVRLLDDPKGTGFGRQEVMLLYGEDMAESGRSIESVTTGGKPNREWMSLEEHLQSRAASSFDLLVR